MAVVHFISVHTHYFKYYLMFHKISGIASALSIVGQAVGFVVSWACLRLYVDLTLHPEIEQTDTRWFGAWWLGWIFFGSILAVLSVLVGFFPKNPVVSTRKVARVQDCKNMKFDDARIDKAYNKNDGTKIQVISIILLRDQK